MRPLIVALNVDAMDWTPLGPAGLYSKMLSRDEDTGARTALQRMNAEEGYQPPKIAHFHTTYEELLGVHGRFSFDQRTWVEPTSYLYHPPETVHGFCSVVPQDSWFLSRVGRNLDVNLVEQPEHDDLYPVNGVAPARAAKAVAAPLKDIGLAPAMLPGASAPLEWCELSVDPATGEGTALVRLPEGWHYAPEPLGGYLEIFTLEGHLLPEGAPLPEAPARTYYFYPPGAPIGPLVASGEALAYVNFGKPLIAAA